MRSLIGRAALVAGERLTSSLALAGPADIVYFGGPIITMDDTRPTVEGT